MAPLTKSQAKIALKAILHDILEDNEEDGTAGPIARSLKEADCRGILDLYSLSTGTLESLSYKDSENKDVPLGKGDIGLLKTLRAFIYHKDSIGKTIDSINKWTSVSLEAFQRFRVSKEWFSISENPGKPYPHSNNGSSHIRDSVSDFKRGIKRDTSLFPTLKQDKQWDVWQRATIAQARAQDLSKILDHKYTPTNPTDTALFAEKKKYMYAVFERTLLSDKGKALVREHTLDYDAQRVYTELCAYALQSTKATIDSSNLLTYITSSRLSDGTWKSGTHAYILHWNDQVRKYVGRMRNKRKVKIVDSE
jgi:hypothetical protein